MNENSEPRYYDPVGKLLGPHEPRWNALWVHVADYHRAEQEIERLQAQVAALKLQGGRDGARIARLARMLDEERDDRQKPDISWRDATS